MGNRYWPMFDLRLTTPDLELRQLTEADLAALAIVLPDDAEQNPAATSYPGLDRDRNRGVVLHQDYWRARGRPGVVGAGLRGVRGRALGKQMRAAVLALAFGALGARLAITSAWTDNHASLAVSRALGYVDNGVTVHRRGETVGEMAHLRLTGEQWLASGWADRVVVEGVDGCLPFFGLA